MPRGAGGGPKTKQGKARSSQNARKHGAFAGPHPFIIEGLETPEEWEELKDGVIAHWQPADIQELELAVSIAFGHLKLRRCRLSENALIRKQLRAAEEELRYVGEDDDDEDEDGEEDGDDTAGAEDEGGEDDEPLEEVDPELLIESQHFNLIPGVTDIDHIHRCEADVLKRVSSDMNRLELLQALRRGERASYARVEFSSGPSPGRRRNANDYPEIQYMKHQVRAAEVAYADRKLAAREAKNGRPHKT